MLLSKNIYLQHYAQYSNINMADLNTSNAHQKYSHFHILIIGWANAGKTTLLNKGVEEWGSWTKGQGGGKAEKKKWPHQFWWQKWL